MKKITFLLIAILSVSLSSCNKDKQKVQIVKFKTKEDPSLFGSASIQLTKPGHGELIPSGSKVSFAYDVKNYQLMAQTPIASHSCANSDKGQHIHFLLNNSPYKALYKPDFDTALADGHYVSMSFLSRSFHESVKNKNAYALTQFDVGSKKGDSVDLTKPMLFFSRPKGVYKGDDIKKVLLDFYLVNTDISPTGNKVRATIDGEEFTLTEWMGYLIKGLFPGEHTIKLELIDKDGKVIPGPYNSTERKFTLEK